MIEEAIIKPIEDYMAGNGELHRFPIVQSARDCCRTGLQTELHNLSSRRDRYLGYTQAVSVPMTSMNH